MELGVCKGDGRILMGRTTGGHELSPTPLVSPCKIVSSKSECVEGPITDSPITEFIFLEDFFDPRARLRRGRIYRAWGAQPQIWQLRGGAEFECETYGRTSIWAEYLREEKRELYVLLGDKTRFTVWKLVDIEVIATGEEMLTLKSLTTFGSLPEILEGEVPPDDLGSILRMLDQVVDEMHTASADSVVDCCREAASEILAAFTKQPNNDLGKLVGLLEQEPYKPRVAHKCAGIITDLHPRRKASEQRRRGLRRLSDEDAQLAVQCLGTILVELDWARW